MEQQTEQPTGLESVELNQGWREMNVQNPVKTDDGLDVFGPGLSETGRAAEELAGSRDVREREREGRSVDVERAYRHQGGPEAGERMPEQQSVSAEQAASDLAGARRSDEDDTKLAEEAELARLIDEARSGVTSEQLLSETPPVFDQQPQPQPVDPQHQQQQLVELQRRWQAMSEQERAHTWAQLPDQHKNELLAAKQSADAEIQRALQQSPALLNAVQTEIARQTAVAQQAAQQYAAAIHQNSRVAMLHLAASYPEIARCDNVDKLNGALHAVEQRDPQRAAAIMQGLNGAKQLWDESVRVSQVQEQQLQARYQQYQANQQAQWQQTAQAHDQAFDKWAEQQGATRTDREAMIPEVISMLRESGMSDQDIAHQYQNGPMRSLQGQQILWMAAKYRASQRGAKAKQYKPVPNVQRPGSPLAIERDEDFRIRQLNKGGGALSAKEAAALTIAKRQAAARSR